MNKKNIETELLREYESRLSNKQNVARNNLNLALQNAEFRAQYELVRTLDQDIAKLESNDNSAIALKSKQKSAKSKLRQLTKKLGFTIDDFKPCYTCKFCHDTGKIGDNLCGCFLKELNKKCQDALSIKIDDNHTFDNFNDSIFDNEEQKAAQTKIKDIFVNYANKFPKVKYKNIVLCGATGVGKTFLTECLAHSLLEKGVFLNFISAFAMNNIFLKYHTTFTDEKVHLLDDILEPEVLIIDDLGTEPINRNVTLEYLYMIISERLNQDKATIVTTNLMPADILSRYGERIFSRISNKTKSLILLLSGKDLRLNNK